MEPGFYGVAGVLPDFASDYSAAGASAAGAASAAFFELRRVVFLAAFLGAEARAASLKSTSSMRAMSAPSP